MSPAENGFRFEEVVTVRKIVAISSFLIAVALVALGVTTAQGRSLPGWSENMDMGVSQARSGKAPLVVVFASNTCHACQKYEQVLARQTTSQMLRGAVKVKLELSNNPELANRFGVTHTPTTLVFTPDTSYAAPVYSETGALNAAQLKTLSRIWSDSRR